MEIVLLYLSKLSGGVNRAKKSSKRQPGNVLGNKGFFERNDAVPKWLKGRVC